MCDKTETLRDREFDSSVRADIDAARATGVAPGYGQNAIDLAQIEQRVSCADLHRQATAMQVAQQVAQGRPNDETPLTDEAAENGAITSATIVDDEAGAQNPFNVFSGAREALRSVLSAETMSEAQQLANEYVDGILQPYYQGRGRFNHVSFLDDLKRAKGGKLTEAELTFFGHVVGSWTGKRASNEYVEAVKAGDLEEAFAIAEVIGAHAA